MPTYEVDVDSKTYEVDAPDPNTAWVWANQFHKDEMAKPTTIGEDIKGGLARTLGTMSHFVGGVAEGLTAMHHDPEVLKANQRVNVTLIEP